MREFFRGWRRNSGVVSLVLALIFMGGWLRSRHTADSLIFPARIHKTPASVSIVMDNLASAGDCFVWDRAHEDYAEADQEEGIELGNRYPIWQSSATLPSFDHPQMKWSWRSCGFGICEYADKDAHIKETFLFIPYWSITLPLTLLSAYLLLVPSRKRTPSAS